MTLVDKGSGGMEFEFASAEELELTREIRISKQFHCLQEAS